MRWRALKGMADHVVWRGTLRLALVSCPVALYSTHRAAGKLHFHFINPKTGHRVRNVATDAETGEEVDRADLVKGYEVSKDEYLLVEDSDFEAARIESSSALVIDKFVDAGSIDPLYYDSSYYVAPDGKTGIDVYAVLREAFTQSGHIALSRIVIGRRERPVAIMPKDDGFILHTLYQQNEILDVGRVFENLPATKTDPEMIKLARMLIERQSGSYDPAADNEDRYETRLRQVIEAKLHGAGVAVAAPRDLAEDNVVDLMALLKQSLSKRTEAGKSDVEAPRKKSKRGTAPAKATATNPSRKRVGS